MKRRVESLIRRILDSGLVPDDVAENTVWLVFERVVSIVVQLGANIWLVRYLGDERFGVLSYALSFVGLFAVFSTLGLDQIVIRSLARGASNAARVIGSALALRTVAGVVTFGVIAALLFARPGEPLVRAAVLIAAAQFLVLPPARVFDLWFQSELLSKYAVWVRSAAMTLASAAKVGFILAGLPLLAFVGLVLFEAVLTAVGLALAFRSVCPLRSGWTPRLDVAVELMRDAWPLILAGLSVSVYLKIDQVMLGEMVGNAAVGIYAVAVRVSEFWYFIPMLLAGSVFPRIVQAREQHDRAAYERRMQLFYDGFTLLSYAVIVPITLVAGPLVRLLFGAQYASAAPILQVHIWAFLFVCMGVARGKWLIAENLTVLSMLTTMLGALTNIVLNVILIPEYGGMGAAWATVASYAMAGYISCIFIRRLHVVLGQLTLSVFAPFRVRSIAAAARELARSRNRRPERVG